MSLLNLIKERRSIRKFTNKALSKDDLIEIVDCGRWTPSGLNHQPWKIIIVQNPELKSKLATCTHYSKIINEAPVLITVLLDLENTYSYVKNVQGIGALFQNMLLAIHDLGLGGVWLGEIYNQKDQVHKILNVDNKQWEFMGAIALGYPNEKGISKRKPLEEIVEWK